MASVDGRYCAPTDSDCFDGIEISHNPKRVHTFVDSENYAIAYAEFVTILGYRCYARGNIRYFTDHDGPAKVGDAVSMTRFKRADF